MDPTKLLPVANADADTAVDRDMEPVPAGEVGIPADAVDGGVAKLRKAVYRATDPAEQNAAAQRLNAAAIVEFAEIRRRPRSA